MNTLPQIDQANPETWKAHLTPELRQHFENMGPSVVEFDTVNFRYKNQEKRFAALYWLREQRVARERREKWTFYLVAATLVASVVAIWVTWKLSP